MSTPAPQIHRTAAAPSAAKDATTASGSRRVTGKPAVLLSYPPKNPKVPGGKRVPPPSEAAPQTKEASAAQDPRFQNTLKKLGKNAAQLKKHQPASEKAEEAQKAAEPPENEKLAGAKAVQVDEMNAAKTSKPEPQSFLLLLKAEIEKVMPKKIGEINSFLEDGSKNHKNLTGALTDNVRDQKNAATGGLKSATAAPPNTEQIEGKPVTPLPPDAAPATVPSIGARGAMPPAKTDEEVSLDHSKQQVSDQLTENKITPDQLTEANDPRFTAVLTAKSEVEVHADSAPAQYRASEAQTLTRAAAGAAAAEHKRLGQMGLTKDASGSSVKGNQLDAKALDEAKRLEVTTSIEKMFGETKEKVEKKLSTLESDVSTKFDDGLKEAIKKMKEFVNTRKDEWKRKRYDRLGGSILWIKDKLVGISHFKSLKKIYEDGRKLFTDDLDLLIRDIAALVERRLKEAKDEVTRGQSRIRVFVGGLEGELQKIGLAAERDVASRFDELRESIDDKKTDLAQNLAQRYKDAREKAESALKEMQEEDKGLVTRFVEKLKEIIEILRNFKNRIMSMLRKAGEVIDLIVAHPIRFLKNLLAAIKQGINQFALKFWEHLKAGFMSWLFGALGNLGLTMPKDFSLPSILSLILQVIGITPEKMRAKLGKLIGERNMTLLEKAWGFLKTLIDGGPAALWEQIKEYVGNLKDMLMEAVQDWVVTSVVKAAVTKIAMMFNPVGAIIQAIITIYNTVMFFIERINQILDFVEAIINSIYKIATGAIADAANWIEQTLVRTIPLIIAFLARFLSLGSVGEKVKGFITRLQTKIDKAIDKVLEKIVAGIKKVVGVIAGGVKAGVQKLVEWWKIKETFTDEEGEKHSLYFDGGEKKAHLMVASNPVTIDAFLSDKESAANASTTLDPDVKARILRDVTEGRRLIGQIRQYTYPPAGAQSPPHEAQVVSGLVAKLVLVVKALSSGEKPVPPMVMTPGFSTNQANGFTVKYLFNDEPANHQPGDEPLDDDVQDLRGAITLLRYLGVRGKWVKFHVLNEKTGGLPVDSNIIPTPTVINDAYKRGFERDMKAAYRARQVVWMETSVSYRSDPPNFVHIYKASGGTMVFESNRWSESKKKKDQFTPFSTEVPVPESTTLFINRIPAGFAQRSLLLRRVPMQMPLLELLILNRGSKTYENKEHMKGILRNFIFTSRYQNPESRMRTFFEQIDAADIDFSV